MKLPRRNFLHLVAGAAALPALSQIAWAQAYPTRPVRVIEGFGAGSALDIVARLIGQSLSEQLGQSFVIENRSGASSNIAAEAVARASPDGYTLLLISTANAVNASMFKLNFDFIRDIVPVASIVRVPLVMEVHPSVPAKTVPEFIAYAKANPGKINMASAGTGALTHMAGEMFKTLAGVAPKSTTAELIERLNKEVNISIADPKFKARLANLGGTVLGGSPADFGKLISDEIKKWSKVIVAANIKPM